jgi:hypothetical protein
MPPHVVMGAMLKCSFGAIPTPLKVLPVNRTMIGGTPAATIMDHLPIVNITPFGVCNSIANPVVAAATAAALGALTPMPCVPVTPAPWAPGDPDSFVGDIPALDMGSICNCIWAGVITIVAPGQTIALI